MKKLLKEPLLHFVLLGFVFFGLYNVVNKQNDSESVILIDDFDINNIIASWEMQWKRLPTDEELKSLVDQNIRQEIFYQEALKMKLDHNDEIIKRRLAQKMQFLSNDLATINEPTDEELKKFYDANFEDYLTPSVYSFYQIIFSPDNRNDPKNDAEQALLKFKELSIDQIKNKGDVLPFPFFFENKNSDEINRQLGMQFSDNLNTLKTNDWMGPVSSGFGYHLVYITEKTGPQIPDFETVKEDLLRDFEYEKQKDLNEQIFNELKKNYKIEFNLDTDKFDDEFVDFLLSEVKS